MTVYVPLLTILIACTLCTSSSSAVGGSKDGFSGRSLIVQGDQQTNTMKPYHNKGTKEKLFRPVSKKHLYSIKTLLQNISSHDSVQNYVKQIIVKPKLKDDLLFDLKLKILCSLHEQWCKIYNICNMCASIFLKQMPWKHKNKNIVSERLTNGRENLTKRRFSSLYKILTYNNRKLLTKEDNTLHHQDEMEDVFHLEDEEEAEVLVIREAVEAVTVTSPPLGAQQTVNITELVQLLRRDISKDPVWATLCVSFLIFLLLLSMKVCGLKPINRTHEIHTDVDDSFNNVDIYEIIRIRQRFLPKRFQKLRRKWRRKWKRKFKIKDVQQQPLQAISDNSEEEREIYAEKMNDF